MFVVTQFTTYQFIWAPLWFPSVKWRNTETGNNIRETENWLVGAVCLQVIHFVTADVWGNVLIVCPPPRTFALRASTSSTISICFPLATSTSCQFPVLHFKELDRKSIVWGHSPPNHHRRVSQSCDIGATRRNHHSYKHKNKLLKQSPMWTITKESVLWYWGDSGESSQLQTQEQYIKTKSTVNHHRRVSQFCDIGATRGNHHRYKHKNNLKQSTLKRRKESGTYLATDSRHRWSVQMTMKI